MFGIVLPYQQRLPSVNVGHKIHFLPHLVGHADSRNDDINIPAIQLIWQETKFALDQVHLEAHTLRNRLYQVNIKANRLLLHTKTRLWKVIERTANDQVSGSM